MCIVRFMEKKGRISHIIGFFADLLYGATKYPCAWLHPFVFIGEFGNSESQRLQKEIYGRLLLAGFRRTFWQLVFPGQIAGLIKRIPITRTGVNEYHIRFYKDGTIECELEVDRWSRKHWTGPREHKLAGEKLLLSIFDQILPADLKERACLLIGSKNFTDTCIRNSKKHNGMNKETT